MNKSRLLGAVCACVFSFITMSANAALVSRLGGAAAYDDVLDITWVTNGALSGLATWQTQVDWAANLDYLGYDDWRLASLDVNGNSVVVQCQSASEPNCRDNELGYMFYQNMGGSYTDIKTGNQTVDDVLLIDVQSVYWSGTEVSSSNAWLFNGFDGGGQGEGGKNFNFYGWAVRSGDVSAVPVPAAVWLFGSGLLGLVGMARRNA